MILAYRFNFFDFVTATIFSKCSVILLITPFTAISLHNFDMYKIISPKNLKRSNSGSLRLNRKILKLCFLNMSSLSFSSSES